MQKRKLDQFELGPAHDRRQARDDFDSAGLPAPKPNGEGELMVTTTPAWTGWLEADLEVATVDISVRLDIVSFWIGTRTVAVLDRDRLRSWAHEPAEPLPIDDIEFVLVDRQLCLRIDAGGPYPLPAGVVSQLVRAL